ncbi:PP2C family protein-serine/threonine phosphatase [Bifidobacterium leontopitheci]|uniref:Protein phosphatase n=1 Tax=Bifidobacterium leontopitheci TaxID=2650774 RepID=A0A6I1GEX5_9BIFI|nr:serine/threonine-protein phosphatase [Bifidobacterium leontopitheci]KAB7790183.1 protein phosphatase [Bifidobacterium leontopitheci]
MTDMHIQTAADSNIGCRRRNNQDNYIAENGVFLVCDGMGGGVGGQRASGAAVDRFRLLAAQEKRNRETVAKAIDLAQSDVLGIGVELGGVSGTTVTGLIAPNRLVDDAPGRMADDNFDPAIDWYAVNIGDSRTYHMDLDDDGRWDPSTLCRITRDHSRRQEAIDTGEMLPDEAAVIPRNIITQCIGDPEGIHPDFFAVAPSGRFIICSDGLHGEVDDATIAQTAAAAADPRTAVNELIRVALEAGGTDNVTVIVIDITGEYAGQRVWRASKLAQDEDLETVSDETLDTLRVQKPVNQD